MRTTFEDDEPPIFQNGLRMSTMYDQKKQNQHEIVLITQIVCFICKMDSVAPCDLHQHVALLDPMLAEFLLDISIVCACAALAIGAAVAVRFQGAASCGVAAAAAAILAIQLDGGGLAEIGLGEPPDLVVLAPWILVGLAGCYAVAGLAIYALSHIGLAPDVTRLDFIKGNLPALALMLAVSWTTAAFGEEIVFRGFLLNRGTGLDVGVQGWTFIVIGVQAVLFGLAHAYQGVGGVILTSGLGLSLGILTYVSGGNLWPAIIVHGLINTVSLTAIYFSKRSLTAAKTATGETTRS